MQPVEEPFLQLKLRQLQAGPRLSQETGQQFEDRMMCDHDPS
jgi:hypothetical protein